MNRRLFRRLILWAIVCSCPALALLTMPVAAEWRHDNKEECGRLDDKLKDIETQRRVGYTPKQGRRLELRREKLEQQRRDKCR